MPLEHMVHASDHASRGSQPSLVSSARPPSRPGERGITLAGKGGLIVKRDVPALEGRGSGVGRSAAGDGAPLSWLND